jgi:hypothetical protein
MAAKQKNDKSNPTYKEIWDCLSRVNCSEHTESKNGLTYLSWAWAWGILMEHYPSAKFCILPEEYLKDETVICNVNVTIGECYREMWLPVLDYRNKPIQNPSSWNINTTRMRVLCKCISLFGLGHYIYAGEDLPSEESGVVKRVPTLSVPKNKSTNKKTKSKTIENGELTNDSKISKMMEDAYKEKIQSKKDRAIASILKDSINAIDDIEKLRDYWTQNNSAIEEMSTKAKQSITNVFQDRAEELNNQIEKERI